MRRVALAALLVLALAGCGTGTGKREVTVDELDEVLAQTSRYPREFLHLRTVGRTRLVVEGAVQDDYRYRATVSLNGTPFYEEVDIDDARYVRLLDRSRFGGVQPVEPGLAAFLAGEWVVDPGGAPPEFSPPGGLVLLGPRLVLGSVRFHETVPELLRKGKTLAPWNPDAATYLPQDDKFDTDRTQTEAGRKAIEREFGVRFDAIPKPFDPGATFTGLQDLEPFFLYTSVWVKDRRVTRIEKLFDLPDISRDPRYRDLRDQLARGASTGGVTAGAELAPGLSPFRPVRYAESYFLRTGVPVVVDPPPARVSAVLEPLLQLLAGGVSARAAPGPGTVPLLGEARP